MTGTTTEAKAILQTERVKAIMAETGMNFAEACNRYIAESAESAILSVSTQHGDEHDQAERTQGR